MSNKVDFEVVLKTSAGLPMVKIEREEFLRTELSPYFDEETVKLAIQYNPARAGIGLEDIDKIAKSCIKYETTKVSAISFVAGIPGGIAMLGTVPADLAQYFGHILRILQKLIYLYGWQELYDEQGNMDDETANLLTLFAGVMFGVTGASAAVTKVAETAATHAAKKIASLHLTKGIIYPIVKKIAIALGYRMTKDIFAKGVAKLIPVLGGVFSGGVTLATYLPMANRLRAHLSSLKLADPAFYSADPAEAERTIEVSDYTETT